MRRGRLPNYLRGARKSLGLSQKELSYLMGDDTGCQLSRYEQFDRTPSLAKALMLEAILGRPVGELFAGIAEEARNHAARRAETLIKRLSESRSSATSIKLEALRNIAGGNSRNNPIS